MTTIAVLDDRLRLVGYKKLTNGKKVQAGDVVVPDDCDLPPDGTYKWIKPEGLEGSFVPLGHGFGKPMRPPVSDVHVLYLLAKNMENPPAEVTDWTTWYETNLQSAQEERAEARAKGK